MRGLSVLLVEDDEHAREFLRLALTSHGYEVIAVRDGLDALRRIELAPPAVIVLDLGLPRVGGADVVNELAAHPETRAIPVVVVTGQDPHHIEGTVACVLRKPVDADAVCQAVRQHGPAAHASLLC
jgi:CheY-like chemotaxis protein